MIVVHAVKQTMNAALTVAKEVMQRQVVPRLPTSGFALNAAVALLWAIPGVAAFA